MFVNFLRGGAVSAQSFVRHRLCRHILHSCADWILFVRREETQTSKESQGDYFPSKASAMRRNGLGWERIRKSRKMNLMRVLRNRSCGAFRLLLFNKLLLV